MLEIILDDDFVRAQIDEIGYTLLGHDHEYSRMDKEAGSHR
jgi:hypothetical protein